MNLSNYFHAVNSKINKQDQLCSVTCVRCNISFNIVQGAVVHEANECKII